MDKMKAVIFGINGQDGYFLKKLLNEYDIEVVGISRNNPNFVLGDVSQYGFVKEIVNSHRPNYIFHLAANSTTRHDALFENHETISTGTLNILEAVYKYSRHTKVFLSGSGLQFVNIDLPISESDTFKANNAYCISRIQSVYAGRYFRSLGVKVYVGYFFNHDSSLRSERHINQKIIATAKRIAMGQKEFLELGDIGVKKEFAFAGDIAQAIFKLVKNDGIFEAVIGSGKAYTIEKWLELCFEHFHLEWKDHVVLKTDFKREYNVLVSDPKTIFSLGWQPEVDIENLAKMMITYK